MWLLYLSNATTKITSVNKSTLKTTVLQIMCIQIEVFEFLMTDNNVMGHWMWESELDTFTAVSWDIYI